MLKSAFVISYTLKKTPLCAGCPPTSL